MQSAFAGHACGDAVGSASVSVHSSTSPQKVPSPQYPGVEHSHEYPAVSIAPTKLVHVARASHGLVLAAHSSTSAQLRPSSDGEVYPAGHVHANEPDRSVQKLASKQACVPVAHSSIWVHASAVAS
jgi:hypothetical protein